MGRPRKRQREDDLNDLEQFTAATGLDLSSPDLLFDFSGDLLCDPPFTNPPNMNFETPFDPGLVPVDSILDQHSNHILNHHENGLCNPNCQETRDAVLFESLNHVQTYGNGGNSEDQTPFQAASLPAFPTPSSSRNSSIPPGKCSCLTDMALSLSTLQSISPFTFPESLLPIRKSLQTTKSVLECPQCPKESTTAMQNILYLTTLLTTITDSCGSFLEAIDVEASRATSANEKKKFRIGDSSPEKHHLHTGTLDCPMGFNVDLDGGEWKMFSRKVVEGYITTPSPNNSESHHHQQQQQLTVLGLADMVEARQLRWHAERAHDHFARNGKRCVPKEGEEFHCLKMVKLVRDHVAHLNL
jgi:hypothetical protein